METPDLDSLALLSADRPKMTGSTNQQVITRVNYTHKDMADFILANPTVYQKELAARYGYRQHTISMIMNSDAFQTYLAMRREDLIDPVLRATVEDRMRNVAIKSLDVLSEKLEMPAVSDELALRAAAMSSKALGMGVQAPAPPPPSVNLNDLAERLASLARRPPSQGVVDVEAREVSR